MWRQKTYNIAFIDNWKLASKQEDWRLDVLILKIVWKTGKTASRDTPPTCINSTSKVCSTIFLLKQTVSEFRRLSVGYSWIARTAKHRELSKFLITAVVTFWWLTEIEWVACEAEVITERATHHQSFNCILHAIFINQRSGGPNTVVSTSP